MFYVQPKENLLSQFGHFMGKLFFSEDSKTEILTNETKLITPRQRYFFTNTLNPFLS